MLILIGVAMFMGSVTLYVVIVVFAILMEIVFIRAEERVLEEQFDEAWLVYRERVRRWI